jgi:hypothetical protein
MRFSFRIPEQLYPKLILPTSSIVYMYFDARYTIKVIGGQAKTTRWVWGQPWGMTKARGCGRGQGGGGSGPQVQPGLVQMHLQQTNEEVLANDEF